MVPQFTWHKSARVAPFIAVDEPRSPALDEGPVGGSIPIVVPGRVERLAVVCPWDFYRVEHPLSHRFGEVDDACDTAAKPRRHSSGGPPDGRRESPQRRIRVIDSRIYKIASSKMNRRSALRLTAAGAGVVVASRYFSPSVLAQVPPLEKKDTYTVGFSQVGSNNPWRLGES